MDDDDVMVCHRCEIVVTDDASFGTDDGQVCEACFDEHYFECAYCVVAKPVSDRLLAPDGDSYCESCWHDSCTICGACGETIWSDDCRFSDYDTFCEPCFFDRFTYCEDCDDYVNDDDPCHHREDAEGIFPYSYKPAPMFFGDDRVYLGLELETEVLNGSRSIVPQTMEGHFPDFRFYCKEDSSLSHGVEIVSHPASLDSWHGARSALDNAMSALRGARVRSWDTETCGIHVHVNVSAFDNDQHMYKFAQLFYKNPTRMQTFAGRNASRWASFDQGRRVYEIIKYKRRFGSGSGERYVAVNMTGTSTVEIRIFRGSLNTDRVLADLELVHAAVEYTRTLSIKDVAVGGLDFGAFRMWAGHRPQYAHMTQLINTRVLRLDDAA